MKASMYQLYYDGSPNYFVAADAFNCELVAYTAGFRRDVFVEGQGEQVLRKSSPEDVHVILKDDGEINQEGMSRFLRILQAKSQFGDDEHKNKLLAVLQEKQDQLTRDDLKPFIKNADQISSEPKAAPKRKPAVAHKL